MIPKVVFYGCACVLGFGTLLNTIGRFSPWLFIVEGPLVYSDARDKVINGTIDFGWFYLQVCNPKRCHTQTMAERYRDHITHANTTASTFAEKWIAKRVGEQTIEIFAFLFNLAAAAGTGLITFDIWRAKLKYIHVYALISATLLLISATMEWANLGEVLAEMGSTIRYENSKIRVSTPSSLVLSALGCTCLFAVSVVYYFAVLNTIYGHSELKPPAPGTDGHTDNTGNGVTSDQSHIESLEIQVNTEQSDI